jgi:hypothetical protein
MTVETVIITVAHPELATSTSGSVAGVPVAGKKW